MEIFIRSQDKKKLLCNPNLIIEDDKITNGNYCVLGEYSNKQRCLEILDEIQTILTTEYRIVPKELTKEQTKKLYENRYTIGYNVFTPVGFDKIEIKSYVYQMPKE